MDSPQMDPEAAEQLLAAATQHIATTHAQLCAALVPALARVAQCVDQAQRAQRSHYALTR